MEDGVGGGWGGWGMGSVEDEVGGGWFQKAWSQPFSRAGRAGRRLRHQQDKSVDASSIGPASTDQVHYSDDSIFAWVCLDQWPGSFSKLIILY